MKSTGILFLLLIAFVFGSCAEKGTEQNEETTKNGAPTLIGTWTLTDETHKGGKNVVWEGRPTVPEMTFRENGYFLFVDRITDEKMKKEGIPVIQDRYKGQFSLKDNGLVLTHYQGDSLITTKYKVEELSSSKLTINNEAAGHTLMFKR